MSEDRMQEGNGQSGAGTGPRKPWPVRNGLPLALAALLAVAGTVAAIDSSSSASQIEEQERQISALSQQINQAEVEANQQVEEDLLAAVGVSRSRLDSDAHLIDSLLETAFTWESGQEYFSARDSLQEEFGLSNDGPFLTEIMPPARYNEDSSGQRYYQIDVLGVTSEFGGADIELASVAAGEYTYAVIASVDHSSTHIREGSSVAERRTLLHVTVDAEGEIAEISGFAPSGSSRHSD